MDFYLLHHFCKIQTTLSEEKYISNWFIYLFILKINLFLAALGLRCCAQAFSSCGEQGYSFLWCVGFSLRWLLLLRSTGSRRVGFSSCGAWASLVLAHGLSSCGSRALERRLSSCGARA